MKSENPHMNCPTTMGHNIFRKRSNEAVVNLNFNDLTYEVINKNQNSKILVNAVSGIFRAGELSAIIGPSGCGKTTLLNLLSGYRIQQTSGQININDLPRDMRKFRKISRYVLQDDHISPYFTIMETMMFASKLKLQSHCSREERQTVIDEILDVLHLRQQANTLISKISGGQRKRVCIALELIDNPSVLFLDEPTTGLDEVSASQCLTLLKQLAKSGRTVICSLHCPSARLFQMFDKVYAMSRGQCIYQGAMDHIVPYLKGFGLHCPVSYNPTDFIIEVAVKAYGDFQDEMVGEIKNGRILKWLPYADSSRIQIHKERPYLNNYNLKSKMDNSPSWWLEYRLIFMRFLEQMWRDKSNCKLRIFVNIFVALLISLAYTEVNRNATVSIFTYHFAMLVIIKVCFLTMVPMLASVPRDMEFMRREYFNQWYRLSSYFMALLTSQLPIIGLTSVIGSSIMYFISGQPVQMHRYALFFGIVLLVGLMASSFGLLLGSRFGVLHALFLGPYILALMVFLASYPAERLQLSTIEYIVVYISFVRYPFDGLLVTLLGFDRPDFPCPASEILCVTSKPKYILKLAGSLHSSYIHSVIGLIGFSSLFTLLAFMIFKHRLERNTKNTSKTSGSYIKLKYLLTKCLNIKLI